MSHVQNRPLTTLGALAATLLVAACSGGGGGRYDAASDAPAEVRCLEAVAGTAGGADVSVLSSTETQEGTEVLVAVAGVPAPWRCEIGEGGRTVTALEYTGTGTTS